MMGIRPHSLIKSLLILALIPVASAHATSWQTAANVDVAPVTVQLPDKAYFTITAEDIAKEVARQLKLQAIEPAADVTVSAGSPKIIHSADHPLELTILALQIDPDSKRWQGQANIRAGGKTETVKPVSGIYTPLTEVPVLKQQVGRTDVIEENDIATKLIPTRQVRKDTITDAKQLIGQSPRATITADRAIRQMEVSSPIVIKRGSPVELTYTTAYMSIKASGVALQDGAKGEMIRVKNDKSEKAVSGRVAEAGRVEVNQTPAM